jgi:hypothetical protein
MKAAKFVFILSAFAGSISSVQAEVVDQAINNVPAAVTMAAQAGEAKAPVSDSGSFMCTDGSRGEDSKIGWDGFLNGLRGFDHFATPIGNPLYFETPLNTTGLRFLYLYHGFPDDSQLQGGQVNVVAMQARVAITERLGFIATKDGYSWLDTGIGISDDGWNDIAAGLKYAFYVDKEADLVISAGARYMLDRSGEAKVLQGAVDELSPFISLAKGFDKFHVMANLTDRIPMDNDDGNNVLQWDLHADYDLGHGIFPMLELHGLHYLSNGERLNLTVGGLDYSNFGSTDVEGSTVIWFDAGARFKFSPHASLGGAFGYPLTNRDADIMGERVTIDFELTW